MHASREIAAAAVALLYWQEEMTPHGPAIMGPYYEQLGLLRFEPLSGAELTQFIGRLVSSLPD